MLSVLDRMLLLHGSASTAFAGDRATREPFGRCRPWTGILDEFQHYDHDNHESVIVNGKAKHHHGPGDSDSDPVGFHRPYWKHAHRDWRLWIAVGLMLLAMLTYVMSDGLAWRPSSHPEPLADTVGR